MTIEYGPKNGLMTGGAKGEYHYEPLMILMRGLDLLVQPRVNGIRAVLPLSGMADGDSYIYTGAGLNQNAVARWTTVTGTWEYFAPRLGWSFMVSDQLDGNDENVRVQFTGTAWEALMPAGGLSVATGDARYEPKLKHNLSATTDPTNTDDISAGYSVMSKWVNTSTAEIFMCVRNNSGNANWQQATLSLDDLGSAALAEIGSVGPQVPTATMVQALIDAYQSFGGSTVGEAGSKGMVPAPPPSDVARYLASDGTWRTITIEDVETTNATNVGSAPGEVYLDKVGNVLRFRTLRSSDGSITFTVDGGTIDLKAVGGGGPGGDGITSVVALGGGLRTFEHASGDPTLQMYSIAAGTNMSVLRSGGNLVFSSTGTGAGGGATEVLLQHSLYALYPNPSVPATPEAKTIDEVKAEGFDIVLDVSIDGDIDWVAANTRADPSIEPYQAQGFLIALDALGLMGLPGERAVMRLTVSSFSVDTPSDPGVLTPPYLGFRTIGEYLTEYTIEDDFELMSESEIEFEITLSQVRNAIGFRTTDATHLLTSFSGKLEVKIGDTWKPFNTAVVPASTREVIQLTYQPFVQLRSSSLPGAPICTLTEALEYGVTATLEPDAEGSTAMVFTYAAGPDYYIDSLFLCTNTPYFIQAPVAVWGVSSTEGNMTIGLGVAKGNSLTGDTWLVDSMFFGSETTQINSGTSLDSDARNLFFDMSLNSGSFTFELSATMPDGASAPFNGALLPVNDEGMTRGRLGSISQLMSASASYPGNNSESRAWLLPTMSVQARADYPALYLLQNPDLLSGVNPWMRSDFWDQKHIVASFTMSVVGNSYEVLIGHGPNFDNKGYVWVRSLTEAVAGDGWTERSTLGENPEHFLSAYRCYNGADILVERQRGGIAGTSPVVLMWSPDLGESWTYVPEANDILKVTGVASSYDSASGTTVDLVSFVGTDDLGYYMKSILTDNRISGFTTPQLLPGDTKKVLVAGNFTLAYGATDLYRLADDGVTWEQKTNLPEVGELYGVSGGLILATGGEYYLYQFWSSDPGEPQGGLWSTKHQIVDPVTQRKATAFNVQSETLVISLGSETITCTTFGYIFWGYGDQEPTAAWYRADPQRQPVLESGSFLIGEGFTADGWVVKTCIVRDPWGEGPSTSYVAQTNQNRFFAIPYYPAAPGWDVGVRAF